LALAVRKHAVVGRWSQRVHASPAADVNMRVWFVESRYRINEERLWVEKYRPPTVGEAPIFVRLDNEKILAFMLYV